MMASWHRSARSTGRPWSSARARTSLWRPTLRLGTPARAATALAVMSSTSGCLSISAPVLRSKHRKSASPFAPSSLHKGAPVLKIKAVLAAATAHKKSAAAVALRYIVQSGRSRPPPKHTHTVFLLLCCSSLRSKVSHAVRDGIFGKHDPVSTETPASCVIIILFSSERRVGRRSGHTFVTASGVVAYDKEDLALFDWDLTALEMAALDAATL